MKPLLIIMGIVISYFFDTFEHHKSVNLAIALGVCTFGYIYFRLLKKD